jgi:hypothetical protein
MQPAPRQAFYDTISEDIKRAEWEYWGKWMCNVSEETVEMLMYSGYSIESDGIIHKYLIYLHKFSYPATPTTHTKKRKENKQALTNTQHH